MKLTEIIARGQPCALRFIPSLCDEETVVPCHLHSKTLRGVGMKVPDFLAVPGCAVCHDIMDQDTRNLRREIPMDLIEARKLAALMETLARLWREGVIGRTR